MFWKANTAWLGAGVMEKEKLVAKFCPYVNVLFQQTSYYEMTQPYKWQTLWLQLSYLFINVQGEKQLILCIWKSDHLLQMFFLVYSGSQWVHEARLVSIFYFLLFKLSYKTGITNMFCPDHWKICKYSCLKVYSLKSVFHSSQNTQAVRN